MRKIIAVLLCMTVLLGCIPALSVSAADSKPQKGDKFMVTSDNGLRLRKSPSTETGAIIRTLPYGTVVTLVGDYGEWANVKAGNDEGWVFTQYIKPVSNTTTSTDPLSHAGILARLDELRVKFPDGKYWNHVGYEANTSGFNKARPDNWTNSPCPSNGRHTSTKWCNGQCDGWARKIGLDLFGASTYDTKKWEKKYSLDNLCIGDLIRFDGWHTVVVTGFTSDKNNIIISDCNWKCNCNIDWDRSFNLSRYASRGYFVLHYKGNTLNKEALQNVGKTTTKPTTTTTKATTTTTKPATTTTKPVLSGSVPSDVKLVRLSGKDRFLTAASISAKGWTSAQNVVLVSSTGFADALAGVPLAYALDAPILLTDGKTLGKSTADEIKRLGAKKVYILGGTGVIGENVEKTLADDGLTVKRISGRTRYETAEKIAEEMKSMGAVKSKTVFIANGGNYPDALAAGPVAAITGSPILYAPQGKGMTDGTSACIKKLGSTEAVILGGEAAVSKQAAEDLGDDGLKTQRCGGSTRYDTAVKINEKYADIFSGKAVCFATGSNFPDALAGGVLAGKVKAPLVLVDQGAKLESVQKFVGSANPNDVYVFGGSSVVSDSLVGYCFNK